MPHRRDAPSAQRLLKEEVVAPSSPFRAQCVDRQLLFPLAGAGLAPEMPPPGGQPPRMQWRRPTILIYSSWYPRQSLGVESDTRQAVLTSNVYKTVALDNRS